MGAATCLFAVLELEILKRTCSMALLTRGSFWSMDGCTTRSTCREGAVFQRAGEELWGAELHNLAPSGALVTPVFTDISKSIKRQAKCIAEQLASVSGIKIPQVIELPLVMGYFAEERNSGLGIKRFSLQSPHWGVTAHWSQHLPGGPTPHSCYLKIPHSCSRILRASIWKR